MIAGIEWVVLAGVVAVLFLWGPDKIPKLARSIGRAKKEYEDATRETKE